MNSAMSTSMLAPVLQPDFTPGPCRWIRILVAPPPLPDTRWWSGPYLGKWEQGLASILAVCAGRLDVVGIQSDEIVNALESPEAALYLGTGRWI